MGYLRKIFFNAGGLEILVHLLGSLQRNTHIRHMVPPETKLFVNLRISVITFDKEFCLLKVSEGAEGKVWRLRIIKRKWILSEVSRISRESRKLPCSQYSRW
jgi:hypothetical protein